jgi:transcriptional regulator with XRE-family HTH domain
MNYGIVFKQVREATGMSRPELAKKLGMTKSALWKIENRQSIPKQTTIDALSKLTGVPVARIVIESIEPEDFFV